MSKQTTGEAVNPTKKGAQRPTRKQFAVARKIAAKIGSEIPRAAMYNRRAMSGFIGANLDRRPAA